MKLTIPTLLTLLRIAMLPVMVVVFYAPQIADTFDAPHLHALALRWSNIVAAAIFIFAALTDWLDGWVARRFQMSSDFGAFLDPVADKLMVAVTLFLLVQQNPTALLAVTSAVIVGREISISALREWMAEIGERSRVNVAALGKIKTIVQIVALVVLLYQKDFEGMRLFEIGEGLLVIAAALTILSALAYVRAAWPALRDGRPRRRGPLEPPESI